MIKRTKLITAIDTASFQQAERWFDELHGHVDAFKLGMEFTYRFGLEKVKELCSKYPIFLDLKLHDIPNTVASALRPLCSFNPKLLTIHASGGPEMIRRSKEILVHYFPDRRERPALLAVTVLTSIGEKDLQIMGIHYSPQIEVLKLAEMALNSGADGIVCSAHEIISLRKKFGKSPIIVTPGIRPQSSQKNDQKRIMTPSQASKNGADWIVVGRPITQAKDPKKMAYSIKNELS